MAANYDDSVYDLSEADIRLKYIDPALKRAGWSLSQINCEVKITDGRVSLKGNKTHREPPKKADYVLYYFDNYPLAIVEAKKATHSVSHGIQQAKGYASAWKKFDVPFVYSSNGLGFQEYDFLTGKERELKMDEFPGPEELYERFKREKHGEGGETTELEARVMEQKYYSGTNTHSPRYYQRIAINRTVEEIARGRERLLLVMATGTGKTYTAFQIVWRLLKSGLKKKILYLADRNILVDQSIQQDFAPLEKVVHKINVAKEDSALLSAYQVYFALYQQLDGDAEEDEDDAPYKRLFDKDYFDLIIVDECHRGSAKENSRWRRILEYFSSATQIGMTATPKETEDTSNINYFGIPVYTYSLREGIDDGFLAPFRIVNITTNISEGWRPTYGQRDVNGQLIEDRIYTDSDFDYNIVIQDRIDQVAREITTYLKKFDRYAKTIVFCANEDHADRMRVALANLNADICKEHEDYVVRITSSDDYGKKKLDYFIAVGSKFPVIATTSELLSTGVDCKMVKLIVLDQKISSMTKFKQILGRGTRLREADGKMFFVLMDFRNNARLFADPDWDGPIEPDPDFDTDKSSGGAIIDGDPPVDPDEPDPPTPPRVKSVVDKNGCKVEIIQKRVSIYDANGRLLRQESIIDYTKSNILGDYASLEGFISNWTAEERKERIRELLDERGIDLEALKEEEHMSDVDDFDFICHVAFDRKPLTRRERANNVKKRDFLSKYQGDARRVLEALLQKYADVGVYEIEDIEVLYLEPFKSIGSPVKIIELFGGKEEYFKALRELEQELYRQAS